MYIHIASPLFPNSKPDIAERTCINEFTRLNHPQRSAGASSGLYSPSGNRNRAAHFLRRFDPKTFVEIRFGYGFLRDS